MNTSRLGLLAFATDTGLGIQTRAIYRHLKPAKTMLVDLSALNHMPVHDDWYDYAVRTNGFPTNAEVDQFLDGLDVVFYCETPLNFYLIERARQLGIKTVLQYNYEFLDYLTPAEQRLPQLPRPDVFAAPTQWNIAAVQQMAGAHAVEPLPVPIDLDELPRRSITRARCFFHIAGRPAIHDRNGTLDFIQAARLAAPHMPEAEFVIYCQQPTLEMGRALVGSPVKVKGPVPEPADMYRGGDVLVLPRRYGGLCLPAQEAVGCGIPVLMPNISPNDTWLPAGCLIQVKQTFQEFQPRGLVRVFSINEHALAWRMIGLYQDDAEVARLHTQANELAERMSWQALKPRYEEVLGLQEQPV
jgi:glycosyltransferase involved in cell wall biosynthesis